MTTFWLVLSSLGGIVAFLGLVGFSIRGVFRQVDATEDNTKAVRELSGKIEAIFQRLNGHENRLGILEDRARRGNP